MLCILIISIFCFKVFQFSFKVTQYFLSNFFARILPQFYFCSFLALLFAYLFLNFCALLDGTLPFSSSSYSLPWAVLPIESSGLSTPSLLYVWPQLICWRVAVLFFLWLKRRHLTLQRHSLLRCLWCWRVRRCVSTFFWGEIPYTSLKAAFSSYKWPVWKLGRGYAWTKIGPLDFGPISLSSLKLIELGEIGPESNGPSEHWQQSQKLTLSETLFKFFSTFWWSVGLRTNSPSSMGFNGLGKICPESNGPIFVHA